jgi:MoaA/NifB/PqqE/SkfB family radical SAM enzyme
MAIEELVRPATSVAEGIADDTPMRFYSRARGRWLVPGDHAEVGETVELPSRLWIYSNYDCNFTCSYCLAMSSPKAERRGIGLDTVKQIVDEAHAMNFAELYFTGGEPMLLPELPEMLAHASRHFPVIVLSNASLASGKRLERLVEVNNPNIAIQVSVDGATAEANDAYRGEGTFERAMRGIRNLVAAGVRVRVSTTETPANSHEVARVVDLVQGLGVRREDHFIRPLIQRGFSDEGLVLERSTLVPEITINLDGVYWHASATEEDLFVTDRIFPLSAAMNQLVTAYVEGGGETNARPFR